MGIYIYILIRTKLGSIVGASLDAPEFHYGLGRHQSFLSKYQFKEFQKYTFGEWIQTFFTLMATKVSICLMLLRISPYKHIRRPIQLLVGFLILSNVVLSLVWILQCNPVDAAWDCDKRETAKCFSQGQVQRVIMSQAGKLIVRVVSVCCC